MRIVIVGLGQAGEVLAKELARAKHEVTVIDEKKELIEEFTNHYDVIGIVGNGASRKVQLQAKVTNADLLISLTVSDEANLLACITAKSLGAKYTIARINAGEYREDEKFLVDYFKIDMIINAESDTADNITRLITYPSSVRTSAFANGKVDVAEIKVKEESQLCNLKLTELRNKFNTNIIIASIMRKGKLIIPRGDVVIKQDDELWIIGKSSDIYHFLNKLKLIEKPVKSIFIVGCGNIGRYLLRTLSKFKFKIKVVEFDNERCIDVMNEFPDVEIAHGDGVDSELLIEEGIRDYDCCISLTGADETNLVVTLFAWSCKIRKLITKITSVNFTKMLKSEEIGNTVSPHISVLDAVHRFVRGISNGAGNSGTIKSLYRFAQNMAEAIEFEITDSYECIGKTLKELTIQKDVVVAFIIRNGEIIMPNGDTRFEMNDRVIVVANADKKIHSIESCMDNNS